MSMTAMVFCCIGVGACVVELMRFVAWLDKPRRN